MDKDQIRWTHYRMKKYNKMNITHELIWNFENLILGKIKYDDEKFETCLLLLYQYYVYPEKIYWISYPCSCFRLLGKLTAWCSIFFRLQCRGVLMKVYMQIKHKLMFKKFIGSYRPMKRFLLVRWGLNLKNQISETH